MRILFVVPEYGPDVRGGIATYYSQLLPAIVKAGVQVDVCVASEAPTGVPIHRRDNGIAVAFIAPDKLRTARDKLGHLAASPAVLHWLALAYAAWEACGRGNAYDVVETTDFALMFVPWLASGSGPPVVVQLHGSSGQVDYYDPILGYELSGLLARLLEAALLGRAEELQSYGAPNGREWSRLLGRHVEHIWPAWRPIETTGQAPPGLDLKRCGIAIGRIQSWKGPEVLCRALALLGDRSTRILWVGHDNPYRSLDRSMSTHLGTVYPAVWGEKVIPVGEHPREVVAAMQREARFAVVPSNWDTFNLALVESMSASNVVICSDGAGAAELIEHGVNGFRFPAEDSRALADLIARASTMPDAERDAMGARGRATITDKLAVDTVVARRMDRYRTVKTQGTRRQQSLWGDNIFAPMNVNSPFAFLNQLPLMQILRHAGRRTFHKVQEMLG
jgi:glycosyltransferase involved in cell wall biosynthesis